ncbi:Geminivirus AR1/BR1 coat protein [Corchorus capsularis]|uniref:Coat protein n=1 Tax=Corchorus capsularis TaxID=210143 RepID=A0A1R3IRV5_COCAP|nr:Geminivirus AR1/BR1 coat protein [Corchorus capsularis]
MAGSSKVSRNLNYSPRSFGPAPSMPIMSRRFSRYRTWKNRPMNRRPINTRVMKGIPYGCDGPCKVQSFDTRIDVPHTGSVTCISDVQRGIGLTHRTGRRFCVKSVYFVGKVWMGEEVSKRAHANIIHFWIVRDRRPGTTPLEFGKLFNMFDNEPSTATISADNRDRCQVLRRWQASVTGGTYAHREQVYVSRFYSGLNVRPQSRTVNRLWGRDGVVKVTKLDLNQYVIQLPNEATRSWILENGPWHIQNRPLFLKKWEPGGSGLAFDLQRFPLWITLKHVPIELYTKLGLSFIASRFGTPLNMDRATAMKQKLSIAKVCVKVNLEDTLPDKVAVELKDDNTVDTADTHTDTVNIEDIEDSAKMKASDSRGKLSGADKGKSSAAKQSANRFAILQSDDAQELISAPMVTRNVNTRQPRAASQNVKEVTKQVISKSKTTKNKTVKADAMDYCHVDLVDMCAQCITCRVNYSGHAAWLVAGDFNIISTVTESSNYNGTEIAGSDISDFTDCLSQLELVDHAYTGPLFTWWNKRDEGSISRKLDQTLINIAWLEFFPNSTVEFVPPAVSNHCAILVKLDSQNYSPPKPFRDPMIKLLRKLKRLKIVLRHFNKEKFGELSDRVHMKREEVAQLQMSVLQTGSPHHSDVLKAKELELKDLLAAEESFYKQKSRVQWVKEGDKAPGPDGFNAHFFQTTWSLVKKDGTVDSIAGVKSVLDLFYQYSGLKLNCEKSELFIAGVSTELEQEMQSFSQFKIGSLLVRYLGLPLVSKNLTDKDYSAFIEKVKQRISHWTVKYLTFAGRLQLIQSVLFSIQNFWCQSFILPSSVIKRLNQLCASFFWKGNDSNAKGARVSWDWISHPKAEGGLSLKKMLVWNQACVIKHLWSIFAQSGSLWVAWLYAYVIKQNNIMELPILQRYSWNFKKILKLRRSVAHIIQRGEWNHVSYTYQTSLIYEELRHHQPQVSWHKLVWFSYNYPRHSLITWMVILDRLPTKDRLVSWNLQMSYMHCVLCGHHNESRDHIFFGCDYSKKFWEKILRACRLYRAVGSWYSKLQWAITKLKGKSLLSLVLKLAWNAFCYVIWRERNSRIFQQKMSIMEQSFILIADSIRTRLLGLKHVAKDPINIFLCNNWSLQLDW